MNITELIVELLEQGQRVELPGIGTFDSVMQSPHHDPVSRIYYPATREVVFHQGTTGDNGIVKTIASRECVGEDVALQMWNNYTDALIDKMGRTGEHAFGALGTLYKRPDGYSFQMAEGVVIEAGGSSEKPLSEVRTYTHSESDDPFAQFDDTPEVTVVQKPEPQPMIPTAMAKPEPEPEPEELDEEWQDNLKKLEELPKSKAALKAEAKAEKARLKAEAKAEKERAKMRKRAQKEHSSAERRIEEDRDAALRREAEEKRRAEEVLYNAEQRAEEERVKAEKEAEAARVRAEQKAHEERLKAEKRAAALAAVAAAHMPDEGTSTAAPVADVNTKLLKEQKEAEHQAAKEAARRLKEEQKQAKADAKEKARLEKAERKRAAQEAKEEALRSREVESGEEDGKKSRRWLLWLLLLLLLLLAGAGAYYLLKNRGSSAGVGDGVTMQGRHFSTSKANQFTFNTDMLEYGDREISRNCDRVCQNMSNYINEYLDDSGYRNARAQVMDRVRQYAGSRMDELMGTRLAAQRFIPYEDYIYQTAEPWLRRTYANTSCNRVQGELMGMLGTMLDEVIDEYGLQPDAAQAPAQPQPAQPAQPTAKKTTLPDDNPVYVYVEKKSKQGFDIVAGFYLNKATAAKMAARLHELGCDAYIIEKNDMYYVSMGSAPTRTKAEALYKHINSWYDGDIVIKQLD